MRYLIIAFTLFLFNVFASSPEEWQKFYNKIESNCGEKTLQYFPSKKFFKIGKIETSNQEGSLIVIFFFKSKDDINIGCIYNQKTGDIEVNQIL